MGVDPVRQTVEDVIKVHLRKNGILDSNSFEVERIERLGSDNVRYIVLELCDNPSTAKRIILQLTLREADVLIQSDIAPDRLSECIDAQSNDYIITKAIGYEDPSVLKKIKEAIRDSILKRP